MDFVDSKESEQLSTRGKMKVTGTVTESWWVCPQRALGAAWRRREATPHSDLGAGGQDLGPAPPPAPISRARSWKCLQWLRQAPRHSDDETGVPGGAVARPGALGQ